MSAGSRLHRNARSTVTRLGRTPGKQRINIGDEKLPTTGKAIRSLIRARYIDGNRCAPGSARWGARHSSNSLEAAGRGRAQGLGSENPTPGSGRAMDQRTLQAPAGQGALAGREQRGLLGAHGDGEPLGLRVGPALVLCSLPSSRGFWMGPRCPLGLQLPACRSYLGRTGPGLPGGPGSARWARLCTVGPRPSFPQRHVPLASPFQPAQGQPAEAAPLRDLSSPAGPGGTSAGGSSPGWT